jgi:hypothetical protein
MKNLIAALLMYFVMVSWVCCSTPKPMPSHGDSGVWDCEAMCANLERLNCAEGKLVGCVHTCQHAMTSTVSNLPASCIATAASQEAARACSSQIKCP